MVGRKSARCLAAVAVAGALCGIVLAGAAQAQARDDLDQLLAQVRRFSLDGRYVDAVPLAERAVTLARKKHGDEHLGFAAAGYWLAVVYQAQARHAEAERLYKHSLAVREKMLGKDHPDVGTTLSDLSILYRAQGRYAEAELLRRRSSAIFDSAGRAGETAAGVFASLKEIEGFLYENMELRGSSTLTESLLKDQLAMYEERLGPEHPNVGRSLHQLARVYREQGRYADAETLYKRSLAIFEKRLGPDHPSVRMSLSSLAILSLARSDLTRAADYWRRSTDVIERRMARGLGDSQEGTLTGEARGDFWGLIRLTYRMAKDSGSTAAAEMFETAQRAAISESADAIAQIAARSTKGSPVLAALIREWQDLINEWRIRDGQVIAAKGEPPAKRKAETEKELSDRLAAIDKRFATIDAQLSKDFPNYAALARSTPISIAELQAELKAQEALVLFIATPQSSGS